MTTRSSQVALQVPTSSDWAIRVSSYFFLVQSMRSQLRWGIVFCTALALLASFVDCTANIDSANNVASSSDLSRKFELEALSIRTLSAAEEDDTGQGIAWDGLDTGRANDPVCLARAQVNWQTQILATRIPSLP